MTAVESRPAGLATAPAPYPLGVRAKGFLALTKPRIIELLLVTTVPTMMLAARGFPGAWVLIATLVGGTLAAGSANTLNCYIDRDIDAVMHRTERRPLVTGVVRPREALVFGLALGVAAIGWLAATTNLVAAALTLAAILFYVLVYTLGLKRRTAQNIVWGGAAGCMPVLIGWSAVTGSLDWAPAALFAIIFFWTPGHYWPLAMRCKEDYAAASVPMLPVVASPAAVGRQTVIYSWLMVGASMLLWPVARTGPLYPVAAAVLGAAWLVEAHRLSARARAGHTGARLGEMRLFHWSITYLTLLFAAIAVDPFVFH